MKINVDYENPVVRGALTLFAVYGDGVAGPEYVCGPTAAAQELFDVSERGDGVVPELVITSRADLPLLLIEGEVLIGAKQNRTLNVTVLCHPKATTVIPVSCVEAGRWGHARKSSRSPWHTTLSVREAKIRSVHESVLRGRGKHSDQSEVWDRVAAFASATHVASRTSALNEVQDGIASAVKKLTAGLEPGRRQCGIVVGIGGEVRALDLFDRPVTLAAYWKSLLSGYAGDAIGEQKRSVDANDVRRFVDGVIAAEGKETPGAGIGVERHFGSEAIAGMELRNDGWTVHLSAVAIRARSGAEPADDEDDEGMLA